MNDLDKKQFAIIVRSTIMTCGGAAPSPDILRIWFAALISYDIKDVSNAFSQYVTRGKFPPKPADILEILDRIKPDGRPGVEEAWSMIPQDEYSSCVMTEEMAQAWGIAKHLLDEGDKIGARMSFKEVYCNLVNEAKRNGIKVKWFASIGRDVEMRTTVLAEAVRLGRLSIQQASRSLNPAQIDSILQISGVSDHRKIGNSEISADAARSNIEKIKLMIGNSRIGNKS